ncbi:hypothetical protein [uncultured Deinococcus sp.]|uniref:hypothetical protein n=1 Tax=uncultured Deinococcus sp. TaxID=158789 RepID=UPI0025F5829B|nr:hypothetical protein [uncultured Deinococcus sp.]
MESLPYVLEVGSQEVILTPDPAHEFTATTEQVALGYGVSASAIREHKRNRGDELVEGKHWVVRNSDTLGGQQDMTLWTKRGIVRLGFFIRSARARLFRDMAEDLVISAMQPTVPARHPALITARAIGESLGLSRNAVLNRLSRQYRIAPVACGQELRQQVCYLYPLAQVAEALELDGWTLAQPLRPYTGTVLRGGPRLALERAQRGVRTRTGKSALKPPAPSFTGMVNRVQAAQELAQLELRRYELMQALA